MVKLVFTKRAYNRKDPIEVDWTPQDSDCRWSSLHYAPSANELLTGEWDFTDQQRITLIADFISKSVPPEGRIYTLVSFSHNKPTTNDLSRFALEIPKFTKGRGSNPDSFCFETKRQTIHELLSSYDDWQITPWVFLVSRGPIAEWTVDLELIERHWIVKKLLLAAYELLVLNDHEHGIDMMTHKVAEETLLRTSGEIATKLGLPLEVQNSLESQDQKSGTK